VDPTVGRPLRQDGLVGDALLNLALFVPFGVALELRDCSALRSLLLGGLLSSLIEMAQLSIPGRVSSTRDIVFNVLGVLAGWTLSRSTGMWVRPGPRVAGRLALVAALTASGLMAGTGFLLRPTLPQTEYFGGLGHPFGHLQWYRGRVTSASLGGLEIRSGRNPDSAKLREGLLRGDALQIHVVAGPPVTALAPLLTIHDHNLHEVLLVGVDRDDLVYRFRTWAAALGFDSPELRVPGAVRGLRPGHSFKVTVVPQRVGYCIQVNEKPSCGLGFTLGWGWALLLYAQGPPPWLQPALNALWMALLGFPPGYWTRSRLGLNVGVGALATSLVWLPGHAGLVATPLAEIGAVVIGFLAGATVRWWFEP
jgi:hypothetical protein